MNSIRNFVPKLFRALNPEFLSFLQGCYRLLYTDRLPAGFNITVHTLEVLAELDEVILPLPPEPAQGPTDGHFERTGLRHATSEDFDGREAPPRTYKLPGDGGVAMRAAQIPHGARRVRSFYFGADSSARGALMKYAFLEGDPATYLLAPEICFHLRASFERAFREHRFEVREDARPDFCLDQPEITDADWGVRGRQVIGCEGSRIASF